MELSNLIVDDLLGLCMIQQVCIGHRPMVYVIPGFDKHGAYRYVPFEEEDLWGLY